MTNECIEMIRENMDTLEYEIVLIDNGSDPPFKPLLELNATEFTGFVNPILIRNEENLGFPKGVNQGIEAAGGDIIILVNNDVIVTPGWATGIIGWLDRFDVVSTMTNYAAGVQRTTIDGYKSYDELKKAAITFHKKNKGQSYTVNYVVGIIMAFRKVLFEEIGKFDESFWPCCGEELDFCLRAQKAGYSIGVARDLYVHHYGSITFKDMMKADICDYGAILERNNKHLIDKWGDGWPNQLSVDARNVNVASGNRLNLGCGMSKLKGFVNIDKRKNIGPDVKADVLNLPYEPNTIDEIYCGHLLEHLTWTEGQDALKHWLALLKSGGKIIIVVPDFDVLAKKYLDNPTHIEMKRLNDFEMYSYVQESHHKYFYSGGLLEFAMLEAGFTKLKRLPREHIYFAETADWQVAFEGMKL